LTEPLFPPLRAIDALAVDEGLEALPLQYRYELVSEIEIASRIGDEDFELAAGRPAGLGHTDGSS
jgi:hypothetical protein